VVLKRITVQVVIDGHVAVEVSIARLEREVFPDRLREAGFGVDGKEIVLVHVVP
jgi:hypothetical protein